MKRAHLIILLAMNFFWAGAYSAYKIIGDGLPAGGIVTLRFGLAGLFLLMAWPWLPGRAPRGRDLLNTCWMGVVLVVVGQRLQVYGNQLGTAGNSSVLMAVEPLITSLAAAVFLREHIGSRRLAGFALGMCGVVLLNGVWRKEFQWTGLVPSLIFVSSFLCEAAGSVLGKPIVARASAVKMLAVALLTGTAINLLIDGRMTLRAATTLTPQAWGLLLALAVICTAIGYTVWFIVIRECPVNVAALTIFAQSVFGVAIAALWVGEKLHWGQLFGSLAIVAGLVLGLSRQIQKPSTSRQSSPA
ncbi:MAG: DMT family transporter [Verrucomicrobiota bacterium]|nr:DMT family transporter [Verrucomicrobiota bacterium]